MKLDVNSKTLVLLQGLPGSGKSTFIQKYNLSDYTLCKDDFRIKAGCVKNGEISQDSNGIVKRIVYMLLEERLKNGVFTVIDETNVFNSTVEKYQEYAEKLRDYFDSQDVRCYIDDRSEKIGRKIRDNELKHTPYLLVVGEKEQAEGTVSFRRQGGGEQGCMKFEDFAKKINEEVRNMTENY